MVHQPTTEEREIAAELNADRQSLIGEYQLALGCSDDSSDESVRCLTDAELARQDEAERRTYQESVADKYYNVACCHSLAGAEAEALAAFQKAADAGWKQKRRAECDTDLDAIRHHNEFQRIMDLMD